MHTHTIHFRATPPMLQELDHLSQLYHCPRSELIRRAVNDLLNTFHRFQGQPHPLTDPPRDPTKEATP